MEEGGLWKVEVANCKWQSRGLVFKVNGISIIIDL